MVVPAACPLLAIVGGTLLGWYLPHWKALYLAGLLPAVPAVLVLRLVHRQRSWPIVALLVSVLLAAALRTSCRLEPDLPLNHLARYADGRPVLLEGTVCDQPASGQGYTRIPFAAHRLRSLRKEEQVQGRVDLLVPGAAAGVRIGDRLLAEARLRPPRNWGNPGEYDRRGRSFLQGIYLRGSVSDPGRLFCVGPTSGYGFWRRVQRVRERIAGFADLEPDADRAALLKAWLIGDRAGISQDLDQAFIRSGLAHLNAISGLQVALAALLVYAALRFLAGCSTWVLLRGWANKAAALGSLPFVVFYVFLAGSPVTAVRAGVMAGLVACSLLLDRAHAAWNGLAVAAGLIVLWDPSALFSVSFLLSFAAVGGLLAAISRWGTPPWRRGLASSGGGPAWSWLRLERNLWQLTVVSLSASVATAPLTAAFFNRVTPLGVLPNLVAVPLVCWLVIPAGLAAVLLSFVSTSLALPLLALAGAGTRLTVWTAVLFSRVPGVSFITGTPTPVEIVLLYLLIGLALAPKGSWRRRRVLPACALALLLVMAVGVVRQRWSSWLEVTYLSVGNGDCALIEFPGGRRMIVDGGPAREGTFDAGATILAPYLGYRRIRRVDYLVASHGQIDHYGGLRSVARDFGAGELWIGPETGCEDRGYLEFVRLCEGRGMQVHNRCGPTAPLTLNGVCVEVLHPPCVPDSDFRRSRCAATREMNNTSLVIRLSYGSVGFLFTGDLEGAGEEQLLSQEWRSGVTVLKAAHHGGAGSNSPGFLEAVSPRAIVVSAGADNRFGFPSARLVEHCRAKGIPLYRTDVDGAVRVRTNGHVVQVRTRASGREDVWSEAEVGPGRSSVPGYPSRPAR